MTKRIKITMLVSVPCSVLDNAQTPSELGESVKRLTEQLYGCHVDAMTARWTTLDAGKTKGCQR